MAYTLLLADDSVTIQRVIELTFADEDIKVVTVGDGQQAIDRIEIDPPSIVLADIGMPKRDGYEVASYVKSRPALAHIPVVLLTGAFEPIDQAKATAVRCDGILAKPFEPQVVINRVRQLLAAAPAPGGPAVSVPAAAGADVRAAEQAPSPSPAISGQASSLAAIDPANDLMMDSMRSKAGTADSRDPLDDYFDQLDAAFEKLGPEAAVEDPAAKSGTQGESVPRPPVPAAQREPLTEPRQANAGEFEWVDTGAAVAVTAGDSLDFSSIGRIQVGAPHVSISPDAPVQLSDLAATPATPRASAPIADVFASMLAAETTKAPAPPVADAPRSASPLPAPSSGAPAPIVMTETLIDEVVDRVLSQLSDKVVRETVAELVSQVAERLVREEIERIKAAKA
jgi:CheY-like chemotaxis protein